jgi:signal transduction histidine kinase
MTEHCPSPAAGATRWYPGAGLTIRGDTRARGARARPGILLKLLVAFGVPTVVLFVAFAAIAHRAAKDGLDRELAARLEAVAASAATQIRGRHLLPLRAGDEDDRAYLNARRRLEALAEATGVEAIYVFDREFRSRVDSREGVPIGTTYFQAELDRHEIGRVLSEGAAASSMLFEGEHGELLKAGYAPVRASESEDEIVLVLGVSAPAAYFAQLAELRVQLSVYGAGLIVVVLGISVFSAALLVRPIRRLEAAARRIGRGDLEEPVVPTTRDEIGFLAGAMDRMRADLRARDQRMQMMLSGIAHEIRNPLGGMELFVGILRDELPEGDERRGHVERIGRELRYLDRVVSEFLDYARRPELELATLDAAELAREVAEVVRAEAEEKGMSLRVEAEVARGVADAGQLRRALLNLVRNAVQAAATANEKLVVVRVAAAGDRARVEVENHGPEIPPEARERVFEPFFTTREKGTGLGLAFAREIANDHGGRISVESNPERTTFTVELRTT